MSTDKSMSHSASAGWNRRASDEAVAKAREALAFTIGVLDNVIMYRTTNDAHNAKMAEVRAALAKARGEVIS